MIFFCGCRNLCKHVFLVSSTHSIPYHDTTAITRRVVDELSNDISNPVIEEGSDDSSAVLQQQPLQLDTLSEPLEQTHAVLSAQIKDLNKSNNRDPVLLESVIQDIKNITSTIESTKHPYRQRR
ncbi:hypothetical protein INT48_002425 [Thamnidium elegans]|uniref:Uncharacterized protein n=1 Tax=Thamnidium elegans TaxID=101142 RepID=A0A8H7ST56_9FUNG|nr:hypothetical protein INT48_002425 [Thamnidium elegans]